ncbi:MAG: HlyD family efflux transporter periplasmic adaptor subunit [Defluviitaleaceae bacterium]|nr:HlyD family efflux transporter periplasmic adaptor subunit [Defluviitaleaceae bacterium]MCL2263245.1 HlyD family efflux transporter periplasmic adaptor subunit [Defluviitaleaceae bacterium]
MNEKNETVTKKKSKLPLILLLTLLLAGGAAVGIYFVWRSTGELTTDNARVTTTTFTVTSPVPGTLERFTLYEGRYVAENEIIGWVENGETMRSPFDAIVLQSNVRQDQQISPMEPLAVLADINRIHIEANIEETDIGRLYRGQRAYVTIDPFGSRQFTGYISEISRVTVAELTGQALFFNTGGNFQRTTHLMPIKITLLDDIILDNFIGVNARVRIPLRD